MKIIKITFSCMVAFIAFSMWAPDADAYQNFSGGCQNCHGGFRSGSYVSNTAQDGVAWGNNVSLHDGHVTIANGNCQACHVQTGDEPLLGGPSGDSFDSCVGCHGRDEDVNSGQIGAGLRQHHTVTGAASCGGCHSDNNPTTFTPAGEDVPGARNADLGIDPCNDAVFGLYGSDNDGDNLYDGNDPDCAQPPVCGNGTIESGEQCDDGNTDDADGCQADCQLPVCGDGIIDQGEQCDDGNTINGDDCQSDCQVPVCGDGIIDDGEICDDGNTANNDGCSSTCQDEFCGDGIVNGGEQCDDGNASNGDGCENDCTFTPEPVCGDGNVDPGEICDDGNNTNGDGCENDCTVTPDPNECSDEDLPTIIELEYNQGDEKLHLHGRAARRTTISVMNSDTGEILAEGIRVRRSGNWEAEIQNVGSSLKRITVTSSNGCSIYLDVDKGDDNEDPDPVCGDGMVKAMSSPMTLTLQMETAVRTTVPLRLTLKNVALKICLPLPKWSTTKMTKNSILRDWPSPAPPSASSILTLVKSWLKESGSGGEADGKPRSEMSAVHLRILVLSHPTDVQLTTM